MTEFPKWLYRTKMLESPRMVQNVDEQAVALKEGWATIESLCEVKAERSPVDDPVRTPDRDQSKVDDPVAEATRKGKSDKKGKQ